MCHIHAASKDGPRYTPDQSDEERNTPDNLLILCPTHHRLVDQEPEAYAAAVLQAIKQNHEADVIAKITSPPEPIDDKTAITLARQLADESVDFAILVALPVELDAILGYFPEFKPVCDATSLSRIYYRASITTDNGIKYRLVTTLLRTMGNLEAAHAANDLIRDWSPRYLIVTGIAGGLRPTTQDYGDVVIPDSIVYYELGKALTAGVEQRSRHFPCDLSLLDSARNMRSRNWRMRLPKRPDGQAACTTCPKVFFGPLASGEKVIASTDTVSRLLEYQPDLLAVEMESAGVASAALGALKKIGFLAVRSICDFADKRKNDNWHAYAAAAAASFLRELLNNQPIAPSSGKWPRSATKQAAPPRVDLVRMRKGLYQQLCKKLDMEEFKNFCFLLDVDIDELPGDRKSARARELILLFERRGKVDELAAALQNMLTDGL